MSPRRILLSSLALCAAGAGGCGRPLPAESAPGVRVDDGRVRKERLAVREDVGDIECIALATLDAGEPVFAVVGGRGWFALDPRTLAARPSVRFQGPKLIGAVRALDIDGDGRTEFVRLGEDWIGTTAAYGRQGALLWSHAPAKLAPTFTLPVDLDGDRKLEFLMGFNGTDEVHLVGCDGRLVWSQRWGRGASDPLALDTDGDGRPEIVYIDGEALCVRNARGELVGRTVPPSGGYVGNLQLVRDPRPGAAGSCLVVDRGLYATDGTTPLGPLPASARPAAVGELCGRATLAGVEWEARLQPMQHMKRVAGVDATRLRVVLADASGAIAYEEVLAASNDARDGFTGGCALLALPAGGALGEGVLVGYGPDLYAYRAK